MKKILSIMPIIFVILVWHYLASQGFIDGQFFPSPFIVFKRLFVLFAQPDFRLDIFSSLSRFFISLGISLAAAFFMAFVCSQYKVIDFLINPLVAITFPLPKVAIMPLLLLLLGIGDASKIAMISLGMFFLLFVHLRKGMLNLDQQATGEIVKIYKVRGINYFYHVLLKGIYLDFLIGLKTAMSYGLTLVVVSEMSMSKNGIGNFIWRAWDLFNVVDMYAAIFILSFLGLFIYLSIDFLIKKNLYKY